MKKMQKMRRAFRLFGVAGALCMLAGMASAASFSEPSTVFYGKVLGIGRSGPPELLRQGVLTWKVRTQEGKELALTTSLYALNKGEFSYRLDVPHRALALGLVLDDVSSVVPLSALTNTHMNLDIKVDGHPALMIGPSGSMFDLNQAKRASLFRLDLAIDREALDTDGDGMPDWWEDGSGLDKQDAGDAPADTDGDGLNNLAEYARGLDPLVDSRLPLLSTRELMVYADGTSGVLLQTLDTDSTPDQLTYMLTRAPSAGMLLLRNGRETLDSPDVVLEQGAVFTQADVQQGRLVFLYADEGETPILFEVAVRDENPDHPAAEGSIQLFPYRPSAEMVSRGEGLDDAEILGGSTRLVADMTVGEDRRLKNYLLAKTAEFQVRDASHMFGGVVMSSPSAGLDATAYSADYKTKYGPDLRQILVGGPDADRLEGGMESDLLVGGRGDDILRGNGGADWFVWLDPAPGNDMVEDFNVEDKDVLDLSEVLTGGAGFIDDYLRMEWVEGEGAVLSVDTNGDGSGYNDFRICMTGLPQEKAELGYLVANGHLVAGGLDVKPRVTVLATDPKASENGPETGTFIISRTGSLAAGLWVQIQVDGSAINGLDYSRIAGPVRIPAGVSSVPVVVTPFADSEPEINETVELVVLPSDAYFVGLVDRASVTIEDLKVLVEIEVLEPMAVRGTLTPGVMVVTRSAILDRSVLVRLAIDGTAQNGVDYQTILGYVNMVPYQTTALIQVTPLAGAQLSNGRESVVITILPDATYLVGSKNRARVLLVEQLETLADWRARHFPGFEGSLDTFAVADSGNLGVSHLLRYAYGLDAVTPDTTRMPVFYLSNGRLTVDLFRNPAATDVEYRIAVSPDLKVWDDSAFSVEEVALTDAKADPGAARFQSRELSEADLKFYMKIEVRQKP